jgi:hypothetical protein
MHCESKAYFISDKHTGEFSDIESSQSEFYLFPSLNTYPPPTLLFMPKFAVLRLYVCMEV